MLLVPVALGAAIYYYFISPIAEQRDRLGAQVQVIEAQNNRDRVFEAQRGQYLRRIAELGVQLKAVEATVPDDVDADDFIVSVNASAKDAGIHVRSLTAQPTVAQESYVEVPFKMRIDGTYYEMMDFFDRLSHLARIANVTGLALGAPTGGGLGQYTVASSETVGANFVLTTYYNRPPGTPAAAKR